MDKIYSIIQGSLIPEKPILTLEEKTKLLENYIGLIEFQLLQFKQADMCLADFIETMYIEEIITKNLDLNVIQPNLREEFRQLLTTLYCEYEKLDGSNKYEVDVNEYFKRINNKIELSQISLIINQLKSEISK